MIKLGLSRKNERATAKTQAKKTRRNGAYVQNPDGTIYVNPGVFQEGENILESRAYLSNQPNNSNKIGNGANNLGTADKLTNILEESQDQLTQKDLASNYFTKNSKGAAFSENDYLEDLSASKQRDWVPNEARAAAKRDLVLILEDPFRDREIGEMDEYENINDEASDEDAPTSQGDTANI